MFIVDTTVWIDFFANCDTPAVRQLLEIIENEHDVFITGIIIQEVLSGIKKNKDRDAVKAAFRQFILIMPTVQTHVFAAEIFDTCHKKGYTIRSTIDCLVAALAVEYDLCLLQNDRDYPHIARVFPLKLSAN
jgi:hypothetical protein